MPDWIGAVLSACDSRRHHQYGRRSEHGGYEGVFDTEMKPHMANPKRIDAGGCEGKDGGFP